MDRTLKIGSLKRIIHVGFLFLLLMGWVSVGYSEEISRSVTYRAEHKPLGDGIDWETSIPKDFDPIFLQFKFVVNPGTLTSEIHGDIIFDQESQTLSVKPRTVTDLKGNFFAGKLENSAGVLLSGEIVYEFEIPLFIFTNTIVSGSVDIPGFPQIDAGWHDEKFFNTFLFGTDEEVEVRGGVRKLVSVEVTAVEIAELLAIALSQGSLPQKIADKAGDILKKYIGDGGIRINGGLENRFVFSGLGIYVDGQLITREGQTVSASGLDPALNSYSISSSFEESLSVALDFILSSDITLKFAPLGLELWSYEKEIAAVPIPLVPDTPIDAFDFTTSPDPVTFPVQSQDVTDPNQSPIAVGSIANQTLQAGGSSAPIDISSKFSDPDNDALTYNSTSSNSLVATAQIAGPQSTIYASSVGSTTITITATDPEGLQAAHTFTVTVQSSTTPVNRAPVVEGTILARSLYVDGVSTTIDVSNYFRDPDGDALTYRATSNNTLVATVDILGGSRIRISPEGNGSATVTVTANDGSLTATQTFSVNVSTLLIIGNRAPIAQGTINARTMTVGDSSTTINVSGYFSDPDGDTLTYIVMSNDENVVSVQRTGSSSIRITPTGDGSATVTVTASDGSLSATQTFSVTVEQAPNDISDSSDVVVENISADYVNNYPGERYTVSVTVRNAGGRRAPNAHLRYYYSSDDIYSTDDEEYENLDDDLGVLDSGETRHENVHLDAPDEEGSYYIIARVARVRNERNTRNNYASIKITVLPPATPDLVVTLTARHRNIDRLTARSYLIDSNDYFKLIANVRNQGKEDARDRSTVRYYFSTDAIISSDDVEFDTERTGRFDAGESDEEITGLRAPEEPGDYYYYAYVDSVEDEGNTDNNYSDVIKVSVRAPDLIIDSVSVDYWSGRLTTVSPNGIFELHATVLNQGTDEGSSSTLRYYVSSDATLSDDDTEFDTDWVHSLDPNEKEDEQSNTTSVNYVSGVFYCFVCIDDVKDELDTTNNCSAPIEIRVRNVAPRKKVDPAELTSYVGTPMSMDGTNYFIDDNNDILRYTAHSNDSTIATADVSGAQVTVTPMRVGSTTITLTASDDEFTATQTVSISVLSEAAWMPDERLQWAIRIALGLQQNAALSQHAVAGLTTLDAGSLGGAPIRDLTGLEYATNLTDLNLHQHQINDITVLEKLKKLTSLDLGRNKISDITPLQNLTTLTSLNLMYNDCWNITPLQNLTVLTDLNLLQTGCQDITPLKDLTSLTTLNLGRNGVRSLTPLQGLTKLTDLDLSFNNLNNLTPNPGDITPLQGLTSLTNLNLSYTSISDIKPLQGLTSLTNLNLSNNQISDITPLQGLNALTNLNLVSNQVSDVAAFENLTALTRLKLSYNPITDYAPLRELKTKNPNLSTDITIPAGPTNRAPVAVGLLPDKQFTVGDSSVVLDVSGNFSDADNDTLTYTASSNNTAVVTASVSSTQVTITPIGPGNATVTVTASDGNLTTTQTIAATVAAATGTNRAPVAVGLLPDKQFTVGDSSVVLDVSGNFSDADNDTLTYTASSNNTAVVTASVSNTQVTITPVGAGNATITVTASDGSLTATQTIAATVAAATGTNRAPTTVGTISAQTLRVGDSSVVLDVSGNFSDADNDTLTYTASSNNTAVATASVSSSQVTITPVGVGNATITVTASDGSLTTTQTIAVTVAAASALNRTPVTIESIPPLILIEGNNTATVSVSGKFKDWDGDPLTYSATSNNTTVATVSVVGTTVTITSGVTGSATVTVIASDGIASVSQTLSVTVITEPTPPSVSVCDRTSQVVTEILNRVSGINECANITTTHLNAITVLFLNRKLLTTLKAGDFNGLNSLTQLELVDNQLTTLDSSIFNGLSNLKHLNLAVNQLTTLDSNVFNGLNSLENLQLQSNKLTSLDSNIFSGLNNLKTLDLRWNELASLPTGIFAGLSSLTSLGLASNSGAPFTLTLKLERTDNKNLTAPGPATIKVKIAEGAPFEMSVNLSVQGGTLSTSTVTIAKGNTESGTITVTPSGNNSVTVNMGSAPSTPLNYTGIETAVGESIVMFPQSPDQNQAPAIVGKIPAQILRVGSSAATVNVSGYFSDPDNDSLTYTASASNASVATVGVSGSTVTITPSVAGRSTVTVTANDGSLTATQTIAVTVEVASSAGVCARTPKVRDEIVARAGLNDCVNVTTTHLASITAINLQLTGLTTLKEGDFNGLTNLSTLWLNNNSISSLPSGIFSGLSNLSGLHLSGNPGAPFTLTLELERTDNTNLLAAGPATVKVKVAEGAPFNMTVDLSVQGGTLSKNTATIPKGGTESSAITVTQTGKGGTGVTLGTVTGKPSFFTGIQTAVGDSINLFSTVSNFAPVSIGTISAQVLTAGGSAGSVSVSSKFSDPDNDTLTYTASSSKTSIATVSVSGSTVTITPVAAGSATVTVTASDGSLTATQTISVTVATAQSANLCDRTLNVQSAILSRITGITDCADVTPSHLNSITSGLQVNNLTTLKENDFDGLGNLRSLFFPSSQLTSLPSGVFDELSSLTSLTIYHSPQLTSLPAEVLDELSNLETLQFRFCGLTSLPTGVLDELSNLRGLDFTFNKLTTLPSGVFGNLSSLTSLNLSNNKLTSLPAGIFVGLSSLTSLNLNGNPGGDFIFTMELERTDNTDLQASGPATVKVKVVEGAPFDMSVSLSVTGGTLSATTATIAKGSTESSAITVTQSGTGATTVTLGTAPTAPSNYLNVKAAVGSSLVLFSSGATNRAPTAVGTISAQSLTVGGSSAAVDVSGKFSDPDNDTLTYTASSSSVSVATVSVSTAQVTITPVAAGSATITVTASDGSLTATQTISVTVTAAVTNRAPTAVGTISAQSLTVGGSSAAVDVSGKFSDPDNDTLTYTASSSGTSVATVSVSTAQVTITPVAVGSATITVTASDGSLTATQTISVTVTAAPSEETWMPDANLRSAVRSALGLQTSEALTYQVIKRLGRLNVGRGQIANLTGLEYATNLSFLSLSLNKISDLTPLKNLTALKTLWLGANKISDLTPLKNLTALTFLSLGGNQISDLTPLKDLPILNFLVLRQNQISDITPLKGLTTLTLLELDFNQISDITPLKGLTALKTLKLDYNRISDLTSLKNLTALEVLGLVKNQISDISPLGSLTTLELLGLSLNQISDISTVQGLTSLTSISLNNNQISDINPLKNLTALTDISLASNQISDINLLKNLTKLIYLHLENNQISNVAPLQSFTDLKHLYLEGNPITDYAPLQTLKTNNSGVAIDIDLNNNLPVFTDGASTTRSVAENTASGQNIGAAIAATDADSDTLTYSLSGTDAATFSIVSTSGQLQTSASLDYETKSSYSVTVTVYDGNSGADRITVTINVTDVAGSSAAPTIQAIPATTALLSNYPNPFNPETWIPYQLSKPADVTLTIYNVRGVVVRQLALGYRAAGVYYSRTRAAYWDGKNNLGEKVATGLYFCTLRAGDFTATRKMLIRK